MTAERGSKNITFAHRKFAPLPEVAHVVREWIPTNMTKGSSLLQPGLWEERKYDILLATTEVFSNAVLHGYTEDQRKNPPKRLAPILVGLGSTSNNPEQPGNLVVYVGDPNPSIGIKSDDDTHGRGLAIVDTLAQTWGIKTGKDAKLYTGRRLIPRHIRPNSAKLIEASYGLVEK
jgi:hypothetical protein